MNSSNFYKVTNYNNDKKCYISYNTSINIVHAFDYAKFIGYPLNTFVTINFYESNGVEIFKIIRRNLFRWFKEQRRRSGSSTPCSYWTFSFEKPHSNLHVHFALHVEDEFREEFDKKIRSLVNKNCPIKKVGQVDIQTIDIYTDKVVANYMIKGVDPQTARILHILHVMEYSGPVFGQRARTCTALSRTARKRAKFSAPLHRHLWVEVNPPLAVKSARPVDWDVSKVIPNSKIVRTLDQMFDQIFEENTKLRECGWRTKKVGYMRRRQRGRLKTRNSARQAPVLSSGK